MTKYTDTFKTYKDYLDNNYPLLLERFPIRHYVKYMRRSGEVLNYGKLSFRAKVTQNNISKKYCKKALDIYHQMVLLFLIIESYNKKEFYLFHDEIKMLFQRNFDRIFKKMKIRDTNYIHNVQNDKFLKDLAICSLIMIPLGAQNVVKGRLPLSIFVFGGFNQTLDLIVNKELFRIKKNIYYRLHMHSKDKDLIKDFNPSGWINFYLLVSKLLLKNPEIIGICGKSWFFDPVIESISPELSYLRETAISCGAKNYKANSNKSITKDSIFLSPKRKELYINKKYFPRSYSIIIHRNELLNWANSLNLINKQ